MSPIKIRFSNLKLSFILTLQGLFLVLSLASCSLENTNPHVSQVTPIEPTPAPNSSNAILENSKQALLAVKTLRMKSTWSTSTGTTEENITFVSPDRYRSAMTKVCSNGAEWESVQIGKMSYTRCPPNSWHSQQMQMDPPHIRIINTYWNNSKPKEAVSRTALDTRTFLSIEAEYARPYNGYMETGIISYLIETQTLLPFRIEIDKVYQDRLSHGTIEFSDFNLPMTIPEPSLQ